jgi:hypothetical protein
VTLAETQRLFWQALRGETADRSFLAGPDRLHVYAEMFLHRQVDALREDFPETAARLGEDKFFELASRYVLEHPSEDPDLGRLGRHFAEFSGEPGAALEWARSEVFLEAEVARMKPEEFAQRLSVRIAPALRLVEGNPYGVPGFRSTVVWRTPGGFELNEVELPSEEAQALRLAMGGASFEEVCAVFGDPARAFEALQSWLAEGWIAA